MNKGSSIDKDIYLGGMPGRRTKEAHQGGARTLVGKRGQQEIVGFALIVVLVVVGLMIFLVYNFTRDTSVIDNDDLELEKLLSSILKYTTTCSIGQNKQTILDMFGNFQR